MKVVLIGTEGRGLAAEVEVDGQRLRVVDRLSPDGEPARPGPLPDPRFEVVTASPLGSRRALGGNPDCETRLEPHHGWRHTGYGRIVSTDPLRIDLGILELALDHPAPEGSAAGDWVRVEIDRILLSGGRDQSARGPRS